MKRREQDEMRDRAAREDGRGAVGVDDAAELLSAHAAGGLTPAETARVEAYLADHPEARAELDAIARTLAAVRAAEPRPVGEPDWDAMARDIQRACADQPAPPWWQIWRHRWRRPVALAAAGAVAMALAYVAVSRGDDPSAPDAVAVDPRPTAPRGGAAADPGAAPAGADGEPAGRDALAAADITGDPSPGADDVHPDLRAPVLGDLSGDELERLEHALDGESAPEDAFVADLLAAGPGEPALVDDGRDPLAEAEDESPGIDPFGAPDYLPIDQLADELPDDAIEAIDRMLAEAQAG